MADLPISFSGPMVRMLIDGKKTQTRRLAKPIKPALRSLSFRQYAEARYRVGDRLYVREHWKTWDHLDAIAPRDLSPSSFVYYLASPREVGRTLGKHRQAMHMPRWASRLFLAVSQVRQEPLQEISAEDAIAEGIYAAAVYGGVVQSWLPFEEMRERFYDDPREAYFALLDHLHGAGFSAGNPMLHAYTFAVHMGNVDAA